MKSFLMIFTLLACTNIKNKVVQVPHSKPIKVVEEIPKTITHQVFDVTINNGKVEFISFPTSLTNGQYEMNCFSTKKEKSFYALLVQDGIAKSYLSESYFSRPISKKCFLQGKHILNIAVGAFPYKREQLNVAKGKIDLSPKDLKRVIAEKKIKAQIYKETAKTYLFTEAFDVPLNSYITSHYGKIRLFNNKKRSQHLGNDLRAAVGVRIPASNRGRVVYVGNLFFSGNVVVIDHGLDIFTLYAHLSKIIVNKGDMLNKGDIVGLAGMTGRVSGPHLHWGVKIAGKSVDGFSLVKASRKQFEVNEVAK